VKIRGIRQTDYIIVERGTHLFGRQDDWTRGI
jgi:hypothetical protein